MKESKKLDITSELAKEARNVMIQYAKTMDKCDLCAFQKDCKSDFASCPCDWEEVKNEKSQ